MSEPVHTCPYCDGWGYTYGDEPPANVIVPADLRRALAAWLAADHTGDHDTEECEKCAELRRAAAGIFN